MTVLRLLDLFCGAGGAARGYAQAGFEVTGVDEKPQPHYPFTFLQWDVLEMLPGFLQGYDLIHASPPCKGYTALKTAPGAKEHPKLIEPTRALLKAAGKPWVIENVEGAGPYMDDPIRLCGTMFGLGVGGQELRRHRLFEASFLIVPPSRCWHHLPVIGLYGGHVRNRAAANGGRRSRDFEGENKSLLAHLAMGFATDMEMTMSEMSDAIPPAYTRHVGEQFLAHLARAA